MLAGLGYDIKLAQAKLDSLKLERAKRLREASSNAIREEIEQEFAQAINDAQTRVNTLQARITYRIATWRSVPRS